MCAVFGGSGKFYGSKIAKSGDIIKFKDAGDWVDSKFKDNDGNSKKQFQITIQVGNEDFSLNLNGTSINNLIPAYDRDSSNWIGKEAKVEIVNVMVAGKMRKMIILHPIEIASNDTTVDWDNPPEEV